MANETTKPTKADFIWALGIAQMIRQGLESDEYAVPDISSVYRAIKLLAIAYDKQEIEINKLEEITHALECEQLFQKRVLQVVMRTVPSRIDEPA